MNWQDLPLEKLRYFGSSHEDAYNNFRKWTGKNLKKSLELPFELANWYEAFSFLSQDKLDIINYLDKRGVARHRLSEIYLYSHISPGKLLTLSYHTNNKKLYYTASFGNNSSDKPIPGSYTQVRMCKEYVLFLDEKDQVTLTAEDGGKMILDFPPIRRIIKGYNGFLLLGKESNIYFLRMSRRGENPNIRLNSLELSFVEIKTEVPIFLADAPEGNIGDVVNYAEEDNLISVTLRSNETKVQSEVYEDIEDMSEGGFFTYVKARGKVEWEVFPKSKNKSLYGEQVVKDFYLYHGSVKYKSGGASSSIEHVERMFPGEGVGLLYQEDSGDLKFKPGSRWADKEHLKIHSGLVIDATFYADNQILIIFMIVS